MNDRRPMRRPVVTLDQRSLGLWFGLAAAVVVIAAIGFAPSAILIGLLALLVVE